MKYSSGFAGMVAVLATNLAAFGQESASPPAPSARIHFKPERGIVGDVHPYFHNGECFLYYLGAGVAAELARSRDLLHWQENPVTHEAWKPDDDRKVPYFVLGVFQDPVANVFRSFYGIKGGSMASSMSTDLLHWSCAPKEYRVPAAEYETNRRSDPYVFWIPELKEYGCVICTTTKKGGTVCLATSPDLKQWKDHGPIIPGSIHTPECPQMFRLGTHWYVLASLCVRGTVGQPSYWVSESPLGPWVNERAGVLDGKDLCAAQLAFDGETPIMFGWIPLKPARLGKQSWDGHLSLPRELYALPDGRLGVRLPAKVTQAFAKLPWKESPTLKVGMKPLAVEGQWNRLAAQFMMSWAETVVNEVRVRVEPLGEILLQRHLLRILDAQGVLYAEVPVQYPLDAPISVRLFIEDDMVEVFVNDRFALAARLPEQKGGIRLSFQADADQAAVYTLRTCAWQLPRRWD